MLAGGEMLDWDRTMAELAAAGPVEQPALLQLDTYEPDLGMEVDEALPAEVRADIRRVGEETATMLAGGEMLDWNRTMAELAAAGAVEQPALLLTVDPRARWVHPDPAVAALMVEAWHRNMRARYPNGTFEVAEGASHMIQFDRADLVLARTRELVEQVRATTTR